MILDDCTCTDYGTIPKELSYKLIYLTGVRAKKLQFTPSFV